MSTDETPWSELSKAERAALAAKTAGLFERVRSGEAEAAAFYAATRHLGLSKALEYVKANPPSALCVLALAYAGHDALLKQQTRAGAVAANRPKAEARAWIESEWQRWAAQHGRKKAEFARDRQPLIRAHFGVAVAHKTITDRWLRGL